MHAVSITANAPPETGSHSATVNGRPAASAAAQPAGRLRVAGMVSTTKAIVDTTIVSIITIAVLCPPRVALASSKRLKTRSLRLPHCAGGKKGFFCMSCSAVSDISAGTFATLRLARFLRLKLLWMARAASSVVMKPLFLLLLLLLLLLVAPLAPPAPPGLLSGAHPGTNFATPVSDARITIPRQDRPSPTSTASCPVRFGFGLAFLTSKRAPSLHR